jgi:hypothetical protein
MVDSILRNENYIGNTVYNRESFPLRERKIKNPPACGSEPRVRSHPPSTAVFLFARKDA